MDIKKLNPWNWLRHEDGSLPPPARDLAPGPHDALLQLHQDFERSFLNLARSFGMGWPQLDMAQPLWPRLDIMTKDNEYVIAVEVPGVDEKDVILEVLPDGRLTVRGEKRSETHAGTHANTRIERSYGAFRRVLALPEDADPDAVSACFRNGVLTITCPRKAQAQTPARQIEIQKVA